MAQDASWVSPLTSGSLGAIISASSPEQARIAAVSGFLTLRVFQLNRTKSHGGTLVTKSNIAGCFFDILVVLLLALSLIACTKEAKEKQESEEPKPTAAKEQVAPPPEPALPAQPVPEPKETKGDWTVQIGAFIQKKNASALIDKLRNKGYKAYALEAVKNGRTWHRVRVGQFPTKEEARSLQETLKTVEGFGNAFIVKRETESAG